MLTKISEIQSVIVEDALNTYRDRKEQNLRYVL